MAESGKRQSDTMFAITSSTHASHSAYKDITLYISSVYPMAGWSA